MCLPFEDKQKSRKMSSQKGLDDVKNHDSAEHLIKSGGKLVVPSSPRRHLSDFMYIEQYENGGGYALHAYADEIARLSRDEINLLTRKFFRTLFVERRKKGISVPFSYFCIGVVHGAAKVMPELVNFMSQLHSNMAVTTNPIDAKNASFTTNVKEFSNNLFRTYCNGLYRYGPMHAISLVGVKGEERGQFCQDILDLIERDPFLRLVLPWGEMSSLSGTNPHNSDDGPILWIRPGEQALPVHGSPSKYRSRYNCCLLLSLLYTVYCKKMVLLMCSIILL